VPFDEVAEVAVNTPVFGAAVSAPGTGPALVTDVAVTDGIFRVAGADNPPPGWGFAMAIE
jgi:hypothetical protein